MCVAQFLSIHVHVLVMNIGTGARVCIPAPAHTTHHFAVHIQYVVAHCAAAQCEYRQAAIFMSLVGTGTAAQLYLGTCLWCTVLQLYM